jgi:hypothetical protein
MRTHIIRRQILEVEIEGTESEGFALQGRLMILCQEWLNPALEDVFDRWTSADEHWTIDRLDIDAGSFYREELERGLVEAVTHAIEQHLRERAPHPGLNDVSGRRGQAGLPAERLEARSGRWAPSGSIGSSGAVLRRTEGQYLQQAFLYFLTTGVLPWWFDLPDGKTLEDLIRETWQAGEHPDSRPGNFACLLAGEMQQPWVLQRLVRQFSADFLETLLASISREGAAVVREVLAKLGRHNIRAQTLVHFAGHLWEAAFAITFAGQQATAETLIATSLAAVPSASEPRDPLLLEQIARLWPGAKGLDNHPEKKASPTGDSADVGLDLEEGVFIRCAGVVVLHPFLPQLFEALGIARNGKLMQPDRALCLLHFLATGHRYAPEYDMLLPKVLCNLPLDAPVDSRIALNEAEQEEAVALLQAVIRHWDALGGTSVDGLRGSFLVRPGKLSRRGADDVLQVEPRSYDILLDRLPWGIGLIQLPWMERTLWVEWRF